MIANYFQYAIAGAGPFLEAPVEILGVIVYGGSAAENATLAQSALRSGVLPAGKIMSGEPFVFSSAILSLRGNEEVVWDIVYNTTMRLRGNPAQCRLKKMLVEIDPGNEPASQVDLQVSREDLEKVVGEEIALQMTATGPLSFFIASQYNPTTRRRLNPLSIVSAESMQQAATIFVRTIDMMLTQTVMVEPCCDILKACPASPSA